MSLLVTVKQVTFIVALVSILGLAMATSAPCCSPPQWTSQVRVITMATEADTYQANYTWHWISYDYNRSLIAIITMDPFNPDVYQRELLDYPRGVRYVTPDEFKCQAFPLQGPMKQMCAPPSGGNVSFDVPMVFGFFSAIPNFPSSHVADSDGMFCETIYYDKGDVTGFVTVATPSCAFVNEVTYAALPGGKTLWQNIQWTNKTLTVDPENFKMPSTCNMSNPQATYMSLGVSGMWDTGMIGLL